jgi:hypothetical protein
MKGTSISLVTLTVVCIVGTLFLLSIALNIGEAMTDKIRLETVDVVAQRFGSAIYMTSALGEGSTQLNLKQEYGIVEEGGTAYVNYSVQNIALSVFGSNSRAELTAPVDFSVEQGRSDSYCLVKRENSDVEVITGECS